MEIILLEKIRNVGDLGEVVNVANGYARNFLIPQKKAMRVSEDALAEVAERKRILAEQERMRIEAAQAKADLGVREVLLGRLVTEDGVLYGSVSPNDIATAVSAAGCVVSRAEVQLRDGSIKVPGEYTATIVLHPEVAFDVQVKVVAEGQGGEPAETTATPDDPPAASGDTPAADPSAETTAQDDRSVQ